jgi:SAM-dependent methyltransferase
LHQGLPDRLFSAPGTWNLAQCPGADCGLAWLDPMPVEEDIGKAYETYYTHAPEDGRTPLGLGFKTYLLLRNGYLSWRNGYRATTFERMVAPLIYLRPAWRTEADYSVLYQRPPSGPVSLLDIGCGDGVALARMREVGWNDLHGVDLDQQAVARARERGIDAHAGTVASAHYPDASFDVITMSHVIEHVLDPIDLMRECHRVLKPGGRMVVVTPNIESIGHRRFKQTWLHLDPPRHLHLFNLRTLRQALDRSGSWRLETLRSTIRAASVIFTASEDIGRRGHAVMGRRGSLWERVKTNGFVYGEALALTVRKAAGEELLLIARRPT